MLPDTCHAAKAWCIAFLRRRGLMWGQEGGAGRIMSPSNRRTAEYAGASNARNLTAAGERSLARGCPYDMRNGRRITCKAACETRLGERLHSPGRNLEMANQSDLAV